MPISRARRFIRAAKLSSDPEMPSAMAMAASLPDWTTRPWMRSDTAMRLFRAANMVEPPDLAPPARHAFSDTTKVSSSFSRPSLISRKAISAVSTLVVEAGAIGPSPFLSNSTLPVSASISSAKGAIV